MARVTVEDCITKIPNRFDLVISAAQRSRQLSSGAPLSIERGNDKNPVAALREIAEESINIEALRDSAIASYRQHPDAEPQEEEFAELLAQESTSSKHSAIIPDSGAPTASSAEEAELEKMFTAALDSEDDLEAESASEAETKEAAPEASAPGEEDAGKKEPAKKTTSSKS